MSAWENELAGQGELLRTRWRMEVPHLLATNHPIAKSDLLKASPFKELLGSDQLAELLIKVFTQNKCVVLFLGAPGGNYLYWYLFFPP